MHKKKKLNATHPYHIQDQRKFTLTALSGVKSVYHQQKSKLVKTQGEYTGKLREIKRATFLKRKGQTRNPRLMMKLSIQ